MRQALAIDAGSSAVRAAVVADTGEVLAERRIARAGSEAGQAFDAELLWEQVRRAATVAEGHDVDAIGVTGHVGTVFVDDALRPVGPGRGWGDAAGVERLELDAAALHASGRTHATGGALAALLDLRSRDPEAFARVRFALQPKDFLIARLVGAVATDHTSAAYTGASLVRERAWAQELLDELGLDATVFPPQRPATAVVGCTSTGIPVVAGGPDGTVGATLVLGTRTDAIADIAGTTDVLVRVVEDLERTAPVATVNPYTLGPRWTVGGATGMTGGAIAWWARLLGLGDVSAAAAQLWTRTTPGAGGVLVDPSLAGSRFPRWQPTARGSVHGLGAEHGPLDVLRGAVEGVAYLVREGVDILDDSGLPVILAGGAARSPELAQLRADVLGRELWVCTEADVSLKGAALLALGDEAAGPALRGGLRRHAPDPARAAFYGERYERWRAVR